MAATRRLRAVSAGVGESPHIGTLYYLPLRGRCECIRMMMGYAGV